MSAKFWCFLSISNAYLLINTFKVCITKTNLPCDDTNLFKVVNTYLVSFLIQRAKNEQILLIKKNVQKLASLPIKSVQRMYDGCVMLVYGKKVKKLPDFVIYVFF